MQQKQEVRAILEMMANGKRPNMGFFGVLAENVKAARHALKGAAIPVRTSHSRVPWCTNLGATDHVGARGFSTLIASDEARLSALTALAAVTASARLSALTALAAVTASSALDFWSTRRLLSGASTPYFGCTRIGLCMASAGSPVRRSLRIWRT